MMSRSRGWMGTGLIHYCNTRDGDHPRIFIRYTGLRFRLRLRWRRCWRGIPAKSGFTLHASDDDRVVLFSRWICLARTGHMRSCWADIGVGIRSRMFAAAVAPGTAFLHSVMMPGKARHDESLERLAGLLHFLLCILGTFLTAAASSVLARVCEFAHWPVVRRLLGLTSSSARRLRQNRDYLRAKPARFHDLTRIQLPL